jgi:hypothetical protein
MCEEKLGWLSYGSHVGPLTLAMMCTKGPVVEFGCGMVSTQVINHLIEPGRDFYSFEEQEDFAASFAKMFLDYPNFQMKHYTNFDLAIEQAKEIKPSVVLIDNETIKDGLERIAKEEEHLYPKRRRLIQEFREVAEIVVVHDTNDKSLNSIDLWKDYKHVWTLKPMNNYPWTTLASMTIDVKPCVDNLVIKLSS